MIYTLTAAFIVSLVDVFIFGNSIIYGITLIVIAGIVSAVGPFLKAKRYHFFTYFKFD